MPVCTRSMTISSCLAAGFLIGFTIFFICCSPKRCWYIGTYLLEYCQGKIKPGIATSLKIRGNWSSQAGIVTIGTRMDDSLSSILIRLFVVLLVVLANGYFVAAEFAV